MLTIHYFASIREAINTAHEELVLPSTVTSVSDLIEHLSASNAKFKAVLDGDRKVLVAVNQTVVGREHQLSANDEIAFFPPMTGG